MTKHSEKVEPYGGQLVDLVANEERVGLLKDLALDFTDIVLNDRQLCDFELLASGAFSPLNGFMVQEDFVSVVERMRLKNGMLWPIPICLDVSEALANTLSVGQPVAIRDPEGLLLAVMKIEDLWPATPEKEALKIYGTQDRSHPGVQYLFNASGSYYIGGKLEAASLPFHFDFKRLRMSPAEVRRVYKKLGWQRVVGFQTENPIHRPQFEMTIRAMMEAKANLLVLPIAGMTKPGDFDYYTRVRCCRRVICHYPPDAFLLNLIPLAMRMAGPREALLHAIISKNYGCTHFIVGHGHASPGGDAAGKPFYQCDAARKLAQESSSEIGIEIISFEEMVYLPDEDEYRPLGQVPKDNRYISISGSDMRNRVRMGRRIPDWATFPEVVEELKKAYPSPSKQGFTVFLTGFSGAGKSTIAKVLYSRFLELGDRPVSLLDGDIVRRNLSSELNFSKEHRDINVRRIGFVASEITKNRGIAICAPIAPYGDTRLEIRKTIEVYGGFIEVFVSTPIEECERRDRKGMYAKAKSGLIKGFTGVDDPYDIPVSPELSIDTTHISPDEAAQEVLLYLGQKGFI
jgi:sulfate adenylyltransferase